MLSNHLQASSRGQATLCAHVVPHLLVHRILSVTGGGTEAFSDDISQAADGTGNVYQTNRIGRQFQYSFIGLQAKSESGITYHLVIYIGMHWSAIGIMWSMKMFWQNIARISYVSAVWSILCCLAAVLRALLFRCHCPALQCHIQWPAESPVRLQHPPGGRSSLLHGSQHLLYLASCKLGFLVLTPTSGVFFLQDAQYQCADGAPQHSSSALQDADAAHAGGKDIAYDTSFTLTADPAGTLTFLFIALKDNAIVSGFEIRDASPPTASPSQAPAGSLQPGAPFQAPVLLQQPSAAAPGQLQAQPPVAPSYTAPMLAPLQLPDQIAIPAPAPAPVLTRLPPSTAQAPLPRSARPPILAPAPVAALSGPPVPGQPQPPVLAPTPGASLSSSSTAAPQPSPGIMLPPSPALAPSQAEPLKVSLAQSRSPSGVPLPAQAPQEGPTLAPLLAPQAGVGIPLSANRHSQHTACDTCLDSDDHCTVAPLAGICVTAVLSISSAPSSPEYDSSRSRTPCGGMVCDGAGPNSITPALAVSAADVNQSTASTSSQVSSLDFTHLQLHSPSLSISMRLLECTDARKLKRT